MQECGHSSRDGLGRLQPVTAPQEVSFARLFPRQKRQRCRGLWILLPELLDLSIGFFPLRNSAAPIAEHRRYLHRRSLVAWNRQDLSNLLGNRIGFHRAARFRGADAEAAEVIVHVVVAVPAPVRLPKSDAPGDLI